MTKINKKNISKKQKFFTVLTDNGSVEQKIILFLLISVTVIFAPYLIAKLTGNISFINNLYLKILYPNTDVNSIDYWIFGIFEILFLAIFIFICKIVYNEIEKIKACINFCYFPLTEEELKENNICSLRDYVQMIYDYTVYSKSKYIKIKSEDYKILVKQLMKFMNNAVFISDKQKWEDDMHFIKDIFYNVEFFELSEIHRLMQFIAKENDNISNIIYQNFVYNEKEECFYIIVAKNNFWVKRIDISLYPSCYEFNTKEELMDILSKIKYYYQITIEELNSDLINEINKENNWTD